MGQQPHISLERAGVAGQVQAVLLALAEHKTAQYDMPFLTLIS